NYPFGHPYTVLEQNTETKLIQPRGANDAAVCLPHRCERITYQYERNPADPRVTHEITLDVDEFGNTCKSVSIAYGRRAPNTALPDADQRKQTQTMVSYSENVFTNVVDTSDDYRAPLSSESRTYELTGYTPTGPGGRFALTDFAHRDPERPQRRSHLFDIE